MISFFQRISSIFFLFCGLLPLAAQHVTVESSLDSTAIRVGEQVQLHISVNCKANSRVQFPAYASGYVTPGVEVLEALPIDTISLEDGRKWQLKRSYTLTSFDSAVYKIPQQEIYVNGAIYKSRHEIALKVNTIDVDLKHPDDIKPAKAPIEGVFTWVFLILACCVLLWLLTIGWVIILRQSFIPQPTQKTVKVKAPFPPHRTAMDAMEQLRQHNDHGGEAQKAYFVQLTDILRTYLYERFGFNAKEMTSQEIIDQLAQINDATALRELREILQTADLIKFARYQVSMAESDRALLQAVDYVKTTQSQEVYPEYEERVVAIEERTILRKRRLYVSSHLTLLILALGLFAYICYLIWCILP